MVRTKELRRGAKPGEGLTGFSKESRPEFVELTDGSVIIY